MHLYENRPRFLSRGIVISILLCAALVLVMTMVISETAARADTQQEKLLADALRRASVTCYAVEGRYPPSLSYLVENYGIIVDESQFFVHYDVFGDNRAPSISVFRRGGDQQ